MRDQSNFARETCSQAVIPTENEERRERGQLVLAWSYAAKEALTADPKKDERRLHRLSESDRRTEATHDGDAMNVGTLR